VFEYAGLLANLAVVVTSLNGLHVATGENLQVSEKAAAKVVVVQAREQGVPVAGAQAAYARAPYAVSTLRAMYASGWIVGTKRRATCVLTRLAPEAARERTVEELLGDGRLLARLKGLRLTPKAAADAYTRGLVSACS
jgi:hypothetical protein